MKYYKYLHWPGKDNRTMDNLKNNAIYLCTPSKFNDPFDFNPSVLFQSTEAKRLTHLTELFFEKEHLPFEVAREKAQKTLLEHPLYRNEVALLELTRKFSEKLRTAVGVSCFTTRRDNSPMWAHYANRHSGICIEWDLPEEEEQFFLPEGFVKPLPLLLQKVEYSKERPEINIFDEGDTTGGTLSKSLLSKSLEWAYEEEWRLIVPGYTGLVHYPASSLTGIIVGSIAPDTMVEEVWAIARTVNPKIQIYRAKAADQFYSYEFPKILP